MIRFIHIRQFDELNGKVAPNGGVTIAYTCTKDEIVMATAYCHHNDSYNKRLGRLIATNRLKSPKVEPVILPLVNPVKETILMHISKHGFENEVMIFLDDKGRWVSTFDPVEEPENFEEQIQDLVTFNQQFDVPKTDHIYRE